MPDPSQIEAIFFDALKQPATDRPALLDRLCGPDAELRQEVERLLVAAPKIGSFLEGPAAPADDTRTIGDVERTGDLEFEFGSSTPAAKLTGLLIASRYRLVEPLGEGGMGSVWLAEQLAPVQRKVALKLIKPGMDSFRVIARFEAERQALAVMDHPNIAKVLDGGTAPDGRPYFVMELVHGTPITEYCDAKRLNVRDRLAIFVTVCQAVQHAHQKGVIHRDLKPSNVLVDEVNGRPAPKVIDFGLAKALQAGAIPDASVDTLSGSILGTPLYMAPEQANIGTADIDTRADVYSLGVLLYELLTGSTPLDRDTARKAALGEVLRLVREVDPPTPILRLQATEALPNIAAVRHTDPRHLTAEVRGELEWVTMKCLEKDRTRRYETANALAEDVLRYLADEPVAAGPVSRWYRTRKFVRRNRGPVAAAALVALVLMGGIVGTSWGLMNAERARKAEGQARKDAETEAAIAKAVSEFQGDLLSSADPLEQRVADPDLKVRTILDRASEKVGEKFRDQPLIEAGVRRIIGETYIGIGDANAARDHLQRAADLYREHRGPDHPDTLMALNSLASAFQGRAEFGRAAELFETVLAARLSAHGNDHPDVWRTMSDLGWLYKVMARYERAEELLVAAVKGRERTQGESDKETLSALDNLASVYHAKGEYDRAVDILRSIVATERRVGRGESGHALITRSNLCLALADAGQDEEALKEIKMVEADSRRGLGEANPIYLTTLDNLGIVLRLNANYTDSVEKHTKALAERRKFLGENHPDTAVSLTNLGVTCCEMGDYDKAESHLRQARVIALRVYPPEHPEVLTLDGELATIAASRGQHDLAVKQWQAVLKARERVLGPDHPDSLHARNMVGEEFHSLGDNVRAAAEFNAALEGRRRVLRVNHPAILVSMSNLALSFYTQGQLDEAAELGEQVLVIRRKVLPPNHPQTLTGLNNLALVHMAQWKYALAEAELREVIDAGSKVEGATHPHTLQSRMGLGTVILEQGRIAEAEEILRKVRDLQREKPNVDPPDYQLTTYHLGKLLHGDGQHLEAEKLLQEVLTIRLRLYGETNWQTWRTLIAIADGQVQQRKFAKAEATLLPILKSLAEDPEDVVDLMKARVILATALAGQSKNVRAEQLLVAAIDGFEQSRKRLGRSGPVWAGRAIGELIELYDTMDKPIQAAEWRAKRPPELSPMPRQIAP